MEDVELPEPESLLEPYPTETGRTFQGQLLDNLTKRWLRAQAEPDTFWTTYPGLPFETEGLDSIQIRKKSYQKFVKDFIRCGAAIDDNIEKILVALEKSGQLENTIIIYTSDQGYFLGEHGFFDKRMMLEESSRMPFVIRYPKDLPQGERNKNLMMNIDIPALLLIMRRCKHLKPCRENHFESNCKLMTHQEENIPITATGSTAPTGPLTMEFAAIVIS